MISSCRADGGFCDGSDLGDVPGFPKGGGNPAGGPPGLAIFYCPWDDPGLGDAPLGDTPCPLGDTPYPLGDTPYPFRSFISSISPTLTCYVASYKSSS